MILILSSLKNRLFCGILAIVLFAGGGGLNNLSGKELMRGDDDKPDLRFEKIHHGVASSQITSILHDSYGFLWVGTNSGVNRYNGVEFDIYKRSEESNSLADNRVGDIYEDQDRNLWIGGRGVISRYQRETDDFASYELSGLPDSIASASTDVGTILEDERGTIWAAGGANGLYYYDAANDSFTAYEPLTTHNITSVLPGEGPLLWLTTEQSGLQKINVDTEEVTSYHHHPTEVTNKTDIVRDHEGDIWIISLQNGVSKVLVKDDGEVIFKQYKNLPGQPKVLGNNLTYVIYVDREGRLWVGNDNGGLHLYDRENDRFHHYDSDPDDPRTLSQNSITEIYQDRNHRLWVGTSFSGLNVMDPNAFKFKHYHTTSRLSNRLSNNIIRGFEEEENGNIWIATDGGGLNYFDRNSGYFSAYRHDPEDPLSIQSDAVILVEKDSLGTLWVGSYNGGLDLMTDPASGRFVSFQDTFDLQGSSVEYPFDVHFDREHPWIWIAEFHDGIYRYNIETGEFERFGPVPGDHNSLSSNYVIQIFEDSNHNIWFSTNNGLNLVSPENKKEGIFHRFLPEEDDPESLPGRDVRQVIEDSIGRIWIVTEYGLARYNAETGGFQTYDASDGLPVNELRSIIEDDNGDFWIGTVQGLSHFDPEEETFVNYSEEDGLQGEEFSRFASYKLNTGELLFGGMNGFNLFYPDEISINPHTPPVYITDFKLFNKPVSVEDPDSPLDKHMMVTDTIVLPYSQNVLSFDFIALNFTWAEQNQYAYMMEGFETDWNYVGFQRNATYTNLNPGTYRFQVKASNNDGVWNEEGAMVTLEIIPPFWQTAWFYLATGIVLILLVSIGFRIKVTGMRRQNRLLEETVKERTSELRESNEQLNKHIAEKNKVYSVLAHDLRSPFMSMIGFSEYLRDKFKEGNNKEDLKIMNSILHAAQSTYNLLENLLHWSETNNNKREVQKEHLDLNKLVNQAISTAELQAGLKEITVENPSDGQVHVLANRNMIQTVLRNLITNAIKFSHKKGKVSISIEENGEQVVTSVIDQGTGMKEEDKEQLFTSVSSNGREGTMGEKGSGFGLMMCKEFVNRNGGKIWISSEVGKGSKFSFSLKKASQ